MDGRTLSGKASCLIICLISMVALFLGVASSAHAEDDGGGSVALNSASTAGSADSISGADNFIFTGAATYSIPITVPPGRLGMAPNLALRYNSQTGDSWVGRGWDLDMGAIERSTKFGLDYGSYDFVFKKNGASSALMWVDELIQPGQGVCGSAQEYHVRIDDGVYLRFCFDETGNTWTAYDKGGRIYFFGQSTSSRVEAGGVGTFSWLLDKVEDANGNYMTASYEADGSQRYLRRIEYAGNSRSGLNPTYYVLFHRELRVSPEYRQTPRLSYATHFQVWTRDKLKTIEVGHVVNSADEPVRAYDISYAYGPVDHSQLNTIREYGSNVQLDGSGWVTGGTGLPQFLTYHHRSDPNEFSGTESPVGFGNVGYAHDEDIMFSGDFNGDNLTDLMQIDESHDDMDVWLSNGDGTFSRINSPSPWEGFDKNYMATLPGDYNGDGWTDILMWHSVPQLPMYLTYEADSYLLISNGDGTFTHINQPAGIGNLTWVSGSDRTHHRAGDFNGDGLTDILMLSSIGANYLFTSNGDNTFTQFYQPDGIWAAGWSDDGNTAHLTGDFNGDGLTDVLQWLKNGTDTFQMATARSRACSTPEAFMECSGGKTTLFISQGTSTATA